METELNSQDTIAGKSRNRRKEILSKDGKWKSFPKVRHLLQYVSTGTYFARVKVNGKLKRESLETDIFSTAELKLADFVKREKGQKLPRFVHAFKDARLKFEEQLENSDLAPATKRYRKFCISALTESWPTLDATAAHKIKPADCEAWADRFKSKVDSQYFNNILGTLRAILKVAGRVGSDDPTREIKRRGVKRTLVKMPSPEQFQKILTEIETSGAGQAKHCADLVRFLAFSGCRLSEAKKVTWPDVALDDAGGGWIKVENAKLRRAADSTDRDIYRFIPIVPPMRELLDRIKPAQLAGPVCRVHECEKSLTRACKIVSAPRLTHHDLRHYFATVCAEKVDPQTFSKWLGHRDGGALAMRTYCHPRKEHEQRMAAQVDFGTGGAK
jgi:integrase